jgi:AcrR family transcriptional regulator
MTDDVKQFPGKQLTHRQRQALATQQLIVDAARELFLEQGYGLTTIDSIGSHAGVATSTVYAVFKNKRNILKAIREAWHQQSGQREIYAQALQEADPKKRLAIAAHATRRQWETSAAMIAISLSAASVDAEAAAELQESLAGRRRGMGAFVQNSISLLRSDFTVEQATALYLALTRAEVYQELVDQWGWSPDEYEQWLAKTLQQQLLDH